MGIASLLLGENNPFAQWTNQNQNLLGAIGAGLGQGQNIQGGLAAGLAAAPQAKQLDLAASEKLKAEKLAENQANATQNWLQANHPDLAQMVQAGMPVSEAWSTAMQRMQPQGGAKPIEINGQLVDPSTGHVIGDYRNPQDDGDLSATPQGRQQLASQYGLEGEDAQMYVLTGKLPGSNQSVRAGVGQPIFGKNKQTGAIEPWQSMTDGTMVNTANPQANPAEYDFNPGIAAGARTSSVVDEKTSGAARAALPSAEQNFAIASRAADALLNDKQGMNEQFGNIMGVPQQMTGAFPGTAKANFRVQLEQLTGQAFLNIRQALKGAGAVTDYEGQRGEVALSRAAAAAEKGDQKAFEAAVIEFKDAIAKGLELLRQQAQGGYAAGTSAVGGAPAALTSGNTTSTGVQWSIEP